MPSFYFHESRDVKSNGGVGLPGPPPLPVNTLAHSAGRSVSKSSVADEGCTEWYYLDPKVWPCQVHTSTQFPPSPVKSFL